MDEREWLECQDPAKMLQWLPTQSMFRSYRLLRLWCASLADASPIGGNVEEIIAHWRKGESYPDEKYDDAWRAANRWARLWFDNEPTMAVRADLLREIYGNPWKPASKLIPVAGLTLCSCGTENRNRPECGSCGKWIAQTDLATCIAIAREIYDEGRWEDMPVLWDALQDAGCADEGIREHLCGGGRHVRGCHVLDAVLGMR